MKCTLFAAAALSAYASAQVTYNSTTGAFVCSPGGGAYCAGASNTTNIILRCVGTVGQPGNCNDNLAGEPPLGVNYSPCIQSSATAGDAACSKNGIVYPDSGATEPVVSSNSSSSSTSSTVSSTPIPSYSNSTSSTTMVMPVTAISMTSYGTSTTGTVAASTASASLAAYTGGAVAAVMVETGKVLGGAMAVILGALAL